MALDRHLQHAKIETDTSRHSGQFECPQSRHFVLIRGLTIFGLITDIVRFDGNITRMLHATAWRNLYVSLLLNQPTTARTDD
jgi:hypothetical protein